MGGMRSTAPLDVGSRRQLGKFSTHAAPILSTFRHQKTNRVEPRCTMPFGMLKLKIFACFLDAGADANATNLERMMLLGYYLSSPREYTDNSVCRLLLEHTDPASFVNDEDLTLAHLYTNCIPMEVSILELLQDKGVDLAATDEEGRTLLHYAACNGSLTDDVVAFLVSRTPLRTDTRDANGTVAVEYASAQVKIEYFSERWEMAQQLLL